MPDYIKPDYGANRKSIAETAIPIWAMIILGTRLLGAFIGVIAMLVGIFMAVKVFSGIYTALTGPAELTHAFNEWSRALGDKVLEINYNNQQYPLTRIMTVIIMGTGAIVLAHLSLSVMLAGMKLITMAGGELEQLRNALKPSPQEPVSDERPYLGSHVDPRPSIPSSTSNPG